MDIINRRRSVRKYRDQAIEPQKIDQMLRAAMQAPSAKNQQPWHFLVIQDRANLIKCSELHHFSKMVAEAGAAIILLFDRRNLTLPGMAPIDMAAATENVLLEATYLGLGAVWIGIYSREDRGEMLRNLFSIPDYLEPFSMVSIGYPLDENANYFKDRYDASRIHYETF